MTFFPSIHGEGGGDAAPRVRPAPPTSGKERGRQWLASVRRGMRLRDTKIMIFTTCAILFVDFVELVIFLRHPCVLTERLFGDECRPAFLALAATLSFKIALLTSVITYIIKDAVMYAIGIQMNSTSQTDRNFGQATGHGRLGWAAASSEGVFRGIVQVTMRSQRGYLMILLFGVLLPCGTYVFSDLAAQKSPEFKDYLAAVCPDCVDGDWSPLRISWGFKDIMSMMMSSFGFYPLGMTMLLRTELWTPAFAKAISRTGNRRMHRILRLHWFAAPVSLVALSEFVICQRTRYMVATALELKLYFWVFLGYTVAAFLILAWSLDLDGKIRGLLCLRSSSVHPEGPPGDNPKRRASRIQKWKSFKNRSPSSDSSLKHRQIQLLMSIGMSMVCTPLGSWQTVVAMWLARLGACLLFLGIYDEPCTLSDLMHTEAAFGLVIEADHLQAALRAYLQGGPQLGPVYLMRANFYRMQDTLTVSYRWSDHQVEICEGLSLNMSRWQLEQLEKGIGRSGCLYVWIDCMALPQKTCKLQTTLLARMMAIYASSRVTLALRTCETERSRYHQRAWTLQEYCNARELDVVTEPCSQQAMAEGRVAVIQEEEELFPEIRQWHQARDHLCRPYWLSGFNQKDDTGGILEASMRFKDLSARLVCKFPADKIRAMYPMLYNTPCEDQTELAGLVQDVNRCEQATAAMPSRFLHQLNEDDRLIFSLNNWDEDTEAALFSNSESTYSVPSKFVKNTSLREIGPVGEDLPDCPPLEAEVQLVQPAEWDEPGRPQEN